MRVELFNRALFKHNTPLAALTSLMSQYLLSGFTDTLIWLLSFRKSPEENEKGDIAAIMKSFLHAVPYTPRPMTLDLTLEETISTEIASWGTGVEKDVNFVPWCRLATTLADVRLRNLRCVIYVSQSLEQCAYHDHEYKLRRHIAMYTWSVRR
jgi:hypothetical protein